MADLKLSLVMTPYDRVLPLINGEVKPEGITIDYQGMPGTIPQVFNEQIRSQRWDVSEMSTSAYLRVRSRGWPYRMLPIFHNRNFSHTRIIIRRGSGIRQGHPEDLKGKRFGIGEYLQSSGLWVRGVLQMEFDVKPEDMIWYQERGGTSSTRVKLYKTETDLMTMFHRNELDASPATGLELSSVNPDLVNLFPDPREEAIRFFKKTGVFPPHHTTVVRESILQEHPGAAISLVNAFEESKRIATERLHKSPPTLLVFGEYYLQEVKEIFGSDPYPYGIKANAKTFEIMQTFSVQQGLTEQKQPLNEIFPEELINSQG